MTVLAFSIPFAILAVAISAVPLLVVSRREVSELVREAEAKFERHRHAHPVRHRAAQDRHTTATSRRVRIAEHGDRPWYEPVLVHKR